MSRRRLASLGVAAVLVVAVGVADWATGTEVRVFPLYYGPISLAAWRSGRWSAVALAVASAVAWSASNYPAGGVHLSVWLFNAAVQLASFALVGWLMALLRAATDRERALARIDPLTGLLNSRAFHEALAAELGRARRYGKPLAVAYLDLDDFKRINDTLGHLEGDAILRSVAQAIREAVRSTDVAARLGGDEFAIVLPEVTPGGAQSSLERVHAVLRRGLAQLQPPVTLSLGAVCFGTPPARVEVAVAEADAVMYRAKRAGKDRVLVEVVDREAASSSSQAPSPPAASSAPTARSR